MRKMCRLPLPGEHPSQPRSFLTDDMEQITVANFTKSGDTLLCKTHYTKRFNEQGTQLGSDKFKQQPVRGLAALNPATSEASAAPAPSASKDFSAGGLPLLRL
jgi:hypothetical protein